MNIPSTLVRCVLSCLLLLGVQACTHDAPEPAGFSSQAAAMLTTTQNWFARTSQSNPVAINWQQARITDNYLVAPFANSSNPFIAKQKYGYRFLVAQVPASGVCTGRLVELVVDAHALTVEQAAKTALTAVQPLLVSKAPVPLESLSGWVLVYSGLSLSSWLGVQKRGSAAPTSKDTAY